MVTARSVVVTLMALALIAFAGVARASANWQTYWGDTASDLSPVLDAKLAANGSGWAANLASQDTYNSLVMLEENLRVALGEGSTPNVPWSGGPIGDDGIANSAGAIKSGLSDDRADATGEHSQTGEGWMYTGVVNQDEIAAARVLYGKVRNALGA